MKFLRITIALIGLLSVTTFAFSGKGTGEADDPYQITTVEQLQEMRDDRTGYYEIMNDIDASDTRNWNIGDHDNDTTTADSAMGFLPVGGNGLLPFMGNLDGNGHTIKKLFINRPTMDSVGLFGTASRGRHGVTIDAVKMDSVYVVGRSYTGSILGYGIHSTTISDCSVSGSVFTDSSFTGGLVGGISSTSLVGSYCKIINSQFEGTVKGDWYIGGIVGYNSGVVDSCKVWGRIEGAYHIGGIAGSSRSVEYANILNSYFNGTLKGLGTIGGISGFVDDPASGYTPKIFNCVSEGSIHGEKDDIGGIIGEVWDRSEIRNCYSTCSVNGDYGVGGVVGYLRSEASLRYTYSIGKVTGNRDTGGLIGRTNRAGTIEASYWNIETSGQTTSVGGEGKTTGEMKQQATFESWNFDSVWTIHEGKSYPRLQWQPDSLYLTYRAGLNGSISGDTAQVLQEGTMGTPITATPNEGYVFDEWSDGIKDNPRTDRALHDITVTAKFKAKQFTLKYSAGSNGRIIGSQNQMVAYKNNGELVTALADSFYHFRSWSDGSDVEERVDRAVTKNIDVFALFDPDTFSVKYTTDGNGTIEGDSIQAIAYNKNSTPVTAKPLTGYHFVKWSDGKSDETRTDFAISKDVTHQAEFEINSYTLKYRAGVNGKVYGNIPQVVTHGSDGEEVIAVADSLYTFKQWSDGVTDNPRTDKTVWGNIDVVAEFQLTSAIIVTDSSSSSEKLLVYPNPVSVTAEDVKIAVPSNLSGTGELTICDNLGATLDFQRFEFTNGATLSWDLRNSSGKKVSSGSYVALLQVIDKRGEVSRYKVLFGVEE